MGNRLDETLVLFEKMPPCGLALTWSNRGVNRGRRYPGGRRTVNRNRPSGLLQLQQGVVNERPQLGIGRQW